MVIEPTKCQYGYVSKEQYGHVPQTNIACALNQQNVSMGMCLRNSMGMCLKAILHVH